MRFKQELFYDALAIRDTSAHNSSSINNMQAGGTLLCFARNSLDQTVDLKYQGSFDGTSVWKDLATAVTVSATTGTDVQTLTDPWPFVRAVATSTVQPASGSLTVHWAWAEGR